VPEQRVAFGNGQYVQGDRVIAWADDGDWNVLVHDASNGKHRALGNIMVYRVGRDVPVRRMIRIRLC
jgi:hypothetical protein